MFPLRLAPPGPRGAAGVPGAQGPPGPPGTTDHSLLTGLGNDDHAQYPLRLGRAGGQTLIGGTAAGDTLTLRPTSGASPTGDLIVDLDTQDQSLILSVPTSVTSATAAATIRVGTGDTLDIGNTGAWRALLVEPTVTFSSATPNNVALQVFSFGPTVVAPVSPLQMRGAGIFRDVAQITMGTPNTAHGSVSTASRPWVTLRNQMNFVAATGTETATYPLAMMTEFLPTVGAGWTVSELFSHRVGVPLGTGVIGVYGALEILDYASRVGTPLSIRSLGSAVEMRHAGPGVFGANAAPTNASVALEVQSTTRAFLLPRMTTVQRDAMTPLDGMVIYNTTTAQKETRQAGAWVAT